ncbi:transcription activator MBF2 domain-containing protein [Phthorimaea operculella]|nr:transcription activator MBF2 domain-containing protein [Phthorimaea operculella]
MSFKTKELLFVSVLILNILKANSEGVSQGTLSETDTLLHRSVEVKIPSLSVRTSDVAYPKYDEIGGIITFINVTDNVKDGGSAEVDYGGVGHTFVNIHLRSRMWGGFNYTVEIYGIAINF